MTTQVGRNKAYHWLTQHAVKYGFIRTVQGETWHWEYHPNVAQQGTFARVKATHNQANNATGKGGGWPAYVNNPKDATHKAVYMKYEKRDFNSGAPNDVKKVRVS
jgi:hypothetical protein